MENFEGYEEVIDEFLTRYIFCFKRGGAYNLYSSRKSIKEQLISKFGRNGFSLEKISNLIKICDAGFENYVEEQRVSYILDEEKLKDKIMNTVHEQETL
jgi:DNA-binding transcriptional MerR regulator